MQTNSPLSIYSENEYKQTIRSVISGKLLKFIADNSIGSLLKKTAELILGMVFGAFIFRPAMIIDFIRETLIMQDYAVPKIMAGFLIFYCRKLLYKIPGKIRRLKKKFENHSIEVSKMVDGIPVDELADYLVRNGNFRREGVNGVRETFGLRMDKFNRLAGKLEQNGVLIRGENNLRKLAPKWSRQALIDFLSQSESSKVMTPWVRVHRIGENAKIRLDRQEILS